MKVTECPYGTIHHPGLPAAARDPVEGMTAAVTPVEDAAIGEAMIGAPEVPKRKKLDREVAW